MKPTFLLVAALLAAPGIPASAKAMPQDVPQQASQEAPQAPAPGQVTNPLPSPQDILREEAAAAPDDATETAPDSTETAVAAARPAYVCPDGALVTLFHDEPAGVLQVTRSGETFVLQRLVSRRAMRFAADEDTIIMRDGQIRLLRGRALRQTCLLRPAAPEAGALWGTVTKLDRMALQPGTIVKVMLVDAARADAPAIEIASQELVTTDTQMPLNFLLRYAPDRVLPRGNSYRLQARAMSPAGKLLYVTDRAHFVLEEDVPPQPADLLLARVGGSE